MRTPLTLASGALDFAGLIREGDTVGWAQATAEPVFLTRLLDEQAPRCPPFRLFLTPARARWPRVGHAEIMTCESTKFLLALQSPR